MAGQVSPFVQRDNLAKVIPGLVLWEEQLQKALTCYLFGFLFAEISSLPEETLLEVADFEIKDWALCLLILALRAVWFRDPSVDELR